MHIIYHIITESRCVVMCVSMCVHVECKANEAKLQFLFVFMLLCCLTFESATALIYWSCQPASVLVMSRSYIARSPVALCCSARVMGMIVIVSVGMSLVSRQCRSVTVPVSSMRVS